MKKIKNIEKTASMCSAWEPSDIAFIKSLEWSGRNLVIVFYCQLRKNANGWPDTSKYFFEISITFNNVSSLKLNFNTAGLQQVSGFDIMDISEDGLEGINFKIEDYENDSISFNCEEVEINEVYSPGKIVIA